MAYFVYDNQVAIRVWRNLKVWGKLPSSHFGHASLTARVKATDARFQVSFWPRDGAGIGLSGLRSQPGRTQDETRWDKVSEMNPLTAKRLEVAYRKAHGIPVPLAWHRELQRAGVAPLPQLRAGQRRLGCNVVLPSDPDEEPELLPGDSLQGIPLYSQSQDVKIVLPGISNKGMLWGLSITRIWKWWKTFELSEPKYRALSKQNCAGIVLQALHEGGSTAFVELPKIAFYAEPRQVEDYALKLQQKLQEMEDAAARLDAEIRERVIAGTLKADLLGEVKDKLWTVARWKELSALGPLKPRSSTIKAIDDALATYHTVDWVKGYHTKWHALVQIFLNIAHHRALKADSDRSAAVLLLGQQVLGLLRNPGGHW